MSHGSQALLHWCIFPSSSWRLIDENLIYTLRCPCFCFLKTLLNLTKALPIYNYPCRMPLLADQRNAAFLMLRGLHIVQLPTRRPRHRVITDNVQGCFKRIPLNNLPNICSWLGSAFCIVTLPLYLSLGRVFYVVYKEHLGLPCFLSERLSLQISENWRPRQTYSNPRLTLPKL